MYGKNVRMYGSQDLLYTRRKKIRAPPSRHPTPHPPRDICHLYVGHAITGITRFRCQSTKLALIKLFPIIRAALR